MPTLQQKLNQEKSYISQVPVKIDKSRLIVLKGDIDEDLSLENTGIQSPPGVAVMSSPV